MPLRKSANFLQVCEKIVDAAGLKTIFSLFMKKSDSTTIEHILGIFTALLRLLPGESAARIRTLAKFAEKDYEKVTKLVRLRADYARKVDAVDQEITLEKRMIDDEEREERSDEFFSRRLDRGLFGKRLIDVILAWLVAEDSGAKQAISNVTALQDIRASLQEQLDGLDSSESVQEEDLRDMLGTLISFL